MVTRRSVLRSAAAALLGLPVAASAAGPMFGRRGLPLGINLYMLAAEYRKDIDATLQAVAQIGYQEVKTSFDVHPPEKVRAALKRSGLRCSNIIVLPTPLRGGMSLMTDAGTLADAVRTVGSHYLTTSLLLMPQGLQMRPLPGENVPQMLARVSRSITADNWRRNADFLNLKGAEFRRHGLRLAHHNHNAEFAPDGETNGLAILLEHTDSQLVDFEMDAGWVVGAGHDPVELFRAFPGPFRLMHIKDVAASSAINTLMAVTTTDVGSGIIDWKRVLSGGIAAGVRHFAVEQEPPYVLPAIESARNGFNYLGSL